MAKSIRRKKQDRARIDSRHAQEARRRDQSEANELFARATDTALPPAALAEVILDGLADSTSTGHIAHTRLQEGADPATLAATAQLLLAACADGGSVDSLPPGVLAFLVVAAHSNGDEKEEARHMTALMGLAQEADEWLLRIAKDVAIWTHPDQAAGMAARYLLAHPRDQEAYFFWCKASGSAEELALREELDSRWPAGLVAGDENDPGYAHQMFENLHRIWDADPQARVRFQNRNEFNAEIMRRRRMPPSQVARLQLAESVEIDS